MMAIDIDALQSTNFEFDIEANRRRRAELANDVTELISISKFFLQHYSSNSSEDLPPLPPTISKNEAAVITKREKNESNVNKARSRQCSNAQTKKCLVANVTPTPVKRKQTRMNNRICQRTVCRIDDDVPPLFDKVKLHQYCVDIVDRFFHGPPPNDSDLSESPKEKSPPKKSSSIEKSVQTTNCNGNETGTPKPKKHSKYASVPSRYMNQTQKKSMNETPVRRNASPFRLVSAKSLEILDEVARKGTEIKRHSCLIHKKEKSVEYKEVSASQPEQCGAPVIRFRDIHPTIELIPSNTIFPKRILKQSEDFKQSSPTGKRCSISSTSSQLKYQTLEKSKINFNETEVENPTENGINHSQPRDARMKGELQLQQLPVLSIRPETKCEIENVYEIEIKPSEGKSEELFAKEKNKVFEVVYESPEKEQPKKDTIAIDCNGSIDLNKDINSFIDERRPSNTFSNEIMTDENRETSNLSMTMSTSSHLTDDEKFRSDRKMITEAVSSNEKCELRSPARRVIDQALEVDDFAEANIETTTRPHQVCIETQPPPASNRSENFDELREILRRIRNDKTTLDLALEDISEPPDFMSSSRLMVDREVQCVDLTNIIENPESTSRQEVLKSLTRQSPTARSSPRCIDSSVLESPKFNKTIESIRMSARKLDFSTTNSEYQTATRHQIEKAAKKFLKSILKNSDANVPQSASEYEDSSNIHLKTGRRNYHIVDDQIIQSNFNVKSDHGDCVTSSSSDRTSLHLRLPSDRVSYNRSTIKCNNWIDQTDSEITVNSIEHYINNYKLNGKGLQEDHKNNGDHGYSDLSDGEILSDGEFHLS